MGRIAFWVLILVVNTLYLFSASQLPDARWDVIGPRGLPIALSILLYALVGADILLKFAPTLATIKGVERKSFSAFEPELIILLGLLVIYVVSVRYIGFLEASFLYIAATFAVIENRLRWHLRTISAFAVALLSVLFVWIVFEQMLNIRVA